MDDKIKDAISKVFEERQVQKKRSEEAQNARLTKEAENLENFKRIREEIIKPALQELIDFLAEKGQKAHITEEDRSFQSGLARNVGSANYSIQLNLFPKSIPTQPMAPKFSFIYEETAGNVRIHATSLNASGPYGTATALTQIDKNWVQGQFTDWFTKKPDNVKS